MVGVGHISGKECACVATIRRKLQGVVLRGNVRLHAIDHDSGQGSHIVLCEYDIHCCAVEPKADPIVRVVRLNDAAVVAAETCVIELPGSHRS